MKCILFLSLGSGIVIITNAVARRGGLLLTSISVSFGTGA